MSPILFVSIYNYNRTLGGSKIKWLLMDNLYKSSSKDGISFVPRSVWRAVLVFIVWGELRIKVSIQDV